MSDILKGRMFLLATASVLTLAAMSWGATSVAQETTDDPAAGGEASIENGTVEDEVTIGDVFDGEVVDEGSVGIVDGDAGTAIDPAEGVGQEPVVDELGAVGVDVTEEGGVLGDGAPSDVDVMLQSGAPEMRADTGMAAPLAAEGGIARQPQAEADHDKACANLVQEKDCVAN